MTLRDRRQRELAESWLNTGGSGIIYACPRFGKIRTSIIILKKLKARNILIAYPDNKIRASWEADFEELGFNAEGVTYTTHLSLKKYVNQTFDLVILDELHLLSDAQIEATKELLKNNKYVLGLTGTLAKDTETTLRDELRLNVVASYSIEKAIEEGIIVDYEIRILKVPLDTIAVTTYKGKRKTEKQRFDSLTWAIDKLKTEGRDTMFLRLSRMRIIQNSVAKRNATIRLLKEFNDKRVLVFCGVTAIADSLGIPSFHSKSLEKDVFKKFANGEGNHLAVVKIGNSGITYKPLNTVIINYFNSNSENLAQQINRCTSMEYDNPEKKAIIYIVSSTEETEILWLKKALEFFDKNKIKYL